jgi:phytanoyl-CoA hydroxylase
MISTEQRAFAENGFLVIEDLLSPEELATLRERTEAIASVRLTHVPERYLQVEPAIQRGEAQAETRRDSFRKMYYLANFDEVYRAHAQNPKILAVIEAFLGPDLKLYEDQLFMKPPLHGSAQGYHQDSQAWTPIVPRNLITCWVALDDATLENGCLRMVRGSHRWGLLLPEQTMYLRKLAERGELPEEVPVPLRAGSCSFHHSLTVHTSGPNRSPHPRWGYATHYMSSASRYLPRNAESSQEEEMSRRPPFLLIQGRSFDFPGAV